MNRLSIKFQKTIMNKFILSLALGSFFMVSCQNPKMEKAEYSGKDLTNTAHILRDKESKEASLHIETPGKWVLYAGNSVDSIDFSKPLVEGTGNGTYSLSVSNGKRSYFQLVTDEGKAILAEQHLPMKGGYNFRDLGGIKNKDSKYIKWGKILRSDDLHNLTEDDLKYLSSVPLISIVDFRSKEEMEKAPDKVPASVKEDYPYSINPGNLMAEIELEGVSAAKMDSAMMNMNILLVTDTAAVNEYKRFFRLLQNENDIPLMFHCSAGKDRTGMGAALILYALGVDEETIYNNYLQSNEYLGDKYASYIAKYPDLEPLFKVKKEFLKAGIDKIKEDHGSVENYLKNVLDVNIDKMKEMYLY